MDYDVRDISYSLIILSLRSICLYYKYCTIDCCDCCNHNSSLLFRHTYVSSYLSELWEYSLVHRYCYRIGNFIDYIPCCVLPCDAMVIAFDCNRGCMDWSVRYLWSICGISVQNTIQNNKCINICINISLRDRNIYLPIW